MMKNYILNLLQQCSEEQFGQDAIEWALVSGRVRLTYDLDHDIRAIMPRYDELIEAYRESLAQNAGPAANQRAPMVRAASSRRTKAPAQSSRAPKKAAAS